MPHFRFNVPSCRHHNAPDHNLIYDTQQDPGQSQPIQDDALEATLAGRMKALLEGYGAPACQYERTGL
jgi:hypothetical protein